VAWAGECRNGPSSSIKCRDMLDNLRDCQLLKEDSAAYSYLDSR
jgi:hypothetical protein